MVSLHETPLGIMILTMLKSGGGGMMGGMGGGRMGMGGGRMGMGGGRRGKL